jgi:hypothetical protein
MSCQNKHELSKNDMLSKNKVQTSPYTSAKEINQTDHEKPYLL